MRTIKFEEETLAGLTCLTVMPRQPASSPAPAILFLHGAGSRGTTTAELRRNPFFSLLPQEADSFKIIAPLCTEKTWFDLFEHLKALSECVRHMPDVDPSRIALIGTSMGGYGAWQLAQSMAECFSSLTVLCGGGMTWSAETLKSMPVWVFHGEEDDVVSCTEGQNIVRALEAVGGNVRMTLLPHTKHNCWEQVYPMGELYTWMLAQRTAEIGTGDALHGGSKKLG